MNLQEIKPSEKSQFQKVPYCVTPFTEHSQEATITDIEDKRGGARGWEWGTGGGGRGPKEMERDPSGDGNSSIS